MATLNTDSLLSEMKPANYQHVGFAAVLLGADEKKVQAAQLAMKHKEERKDTPVYLVQDAHEHHAPASTPRGTPPKTPSKN
jgi:hypothetical protein